MTTDRKSLFRFPVGIAAAGLVAGIAGNALAQQRPISINQWLQAESGNVNMQRAIQEYERAQFGTATQPPAYQAPQYQQPQYQQPLYQAPQQTYRQQPYYPQQQAQTPQPAPQSAPQATPQQPVQQQPQQLIPGQAQPQGQLPQQPNQQNTYQVPPDALEKIDRDYNPDREVGGPSRFYLGGHIGWPFWMTANVDAATTDNELGMSLLAFRAGGTVGYQLSKHFSAELEGAYQFAEQSGSYDGTISVWSLMPMARVEFNSGINSVSPYLTGGLGLAKFQADDLVQLATGNTDSDSGFAMSYQFGGGVTYPIADRTKLDLGYRYFGTSDADLELFDIEYSGNVSSHTLLLGVKHQL